MPNGEFGLELLKGMPGEPKTPVEPPLALARDPAQFGEEAIGVAARFRDYEFRQEWARYVEAGWVMPDLSKYEVWDMSTQAKAARAKAEQYQAMQEKVWSEIQTKYEGYLTQLVSFVNQAGLREETPSAEMMMRMFAGGKTEKDIYTRMFRARTEKEAIPEFQTRKAEILGYPGFSYQQKEAYISNLAWKLREKGVSDPIIQNLIREGRTEAVRQLPPEEIARMQAGAIERSEAQAAGMDVLEYRKRGQKSPEQLAAEEEQKRRYAEVQKWSSMRTERIAKL